MLALLAVVALCDESDPFMSKLSGAVVQLNGNLFDQCSAYRGGAISVANCTLSVTGCGFRDCRSATFGGAFYQTGGTLLLQRTCFVRCMCTSYTSEQGGNVFQTEYVDSTIAENTAYFCAPTTSSADSLFHVFYNSCHMRFWNSSFCYGQVGSSGGSFRYQTDSYNYMANNVNCKDHNSMEGWYSSLTISRTNFINNTYNTGANAYGYQNTLMLFSQCIFIQHKAAYAPGATSFTFTDCYTDVADAYLVNASTGITQLPNAALDQQLCFFGTEAFTASNILLNPSYFAVALPLILP